jgi:hypothetical protein
VLTEAIPVERFDRGDDPSVKLAATIVQPPTVRHVVTERMLEGVLEIGKQAGLVEELGSLQVRCAGSARSRLWSSGTPPSRRLRP